MGGIGLSEALALFRRVAMQNPFVVLPGLLVTWFIAFMLDWHLAVRLVMLGLVHLLNMGYARRPVVYLPELYIDPRVRLLFTGLAIALMAWEVVYACRR